AIRADVVVHDGQIVVTNEGVERIKPIRPFNDVVYDDDIRRRRVLGDFKPPPPAKMLLSVKTESDLPVRGSEVNATARAELSFDTQGGVMSGSGRLTVQNGWLNLFGKRWDIQRADITLLGTDEPRLEVEIARDLGTAVALVRITGSPKAPELELS